MEVALADDMLMLDAFSQETLPLLPELRSAARRFAGARRDVADDLIQETWLRALASSHRYQPGTNARAWLYAILTNAARSAFRRDRRDLRLRDRYARERDGDRIEPCESLAQAGTEARPALSQAVRAILSGLPESYRQVVELVDLHGLSYREVAARLGCPVGTVMSRLHRGRHKMRAALDATSAGG